MSKKKKYTWVIVNNKQHMDAIRESKIVQDGLTSQMYIWVPRWVKQAISMYETNEGYAGLSLSEYLAIMTPEKVKV